MTDFSLARISRWTGALLLATLLGIGAAVPMQAQTVRLHLSADSVYVGERFTVSVTATHRFSSTALFPDAGAGPAVFGDLDVIRRMDASRRFLGPDQPGTRVDSVAYEVTTFAVDTARIPPLPVRLAAQGDTIRLATSPRRIPVRSTVPPEAQGIRDMTALAAFPTPLWPWVLLSLAALVVVGGLVYYWRQRHQEEPKAEPDAAPDAPRVPPAEVARRRLRRLRRTTDPDALDDPKSFYIELSDLLRTYLAHRLQIPALERTTAELTQALHQHPDVPAAVTTPIQTVLDQADLVKFAEAQPPPEQHRSTLQTTATAIDAMEDALRPLDAPEEHTAPAPSAPPSSAAS